MAFTALLGITQLVATGTEFLMNFKSLKSPDSKDVRLVISGFMEGDLGQLIKLSLVNQTNKPFSIISLNVITEEGNSDLAPIRSFECKYLGSGEPYNLEFKADTAVCTVERNDIHYHDMSFFNNKSFLLPDQAETGWIIIPGKKKGLENIIGISLTVSTIPEQITSYFSDYSSE